MKRWLIALVLGLTALATVFVLWQREAARRAEGPPATDMLATPAEAPGALTAADTEPAAPTGPADTIIRVDDAWARVTAPGQDSTAIYMLITNTSQTPDRIVSVRAPAAKTAVIHETIIDDKNVATMKPALHIDLDPGVPLVFEPGGLHVMLSGLDHPLNPGDMVTVIFTLQHSGTLSVDIPVGEPQANSDSVAP